MKYKGLIIGTVFVVSVGVFLETLARFNLAMNYVATSQEVGKYKGQFDAELGWSIGPHDVNGARPSPNSYGDPLLAVFGGSVTYGRAVEDNETWEYLLAEQSKRDVYNFGQRGFSADQSYLRYLRIGKNVKPQYFAIGVTLRGINAIMTTYQKFYRPDSGIPLTKPRFEIKRGELKRVPNPLVSADQMDKLRSAEFIASLSQMDPWYLSRKTEWLNQILPHFLRPSRMLEDADLNLWNDPKARDLMAKILTQFTRDVRNQGAQPVILILPVAEDLKAAMNGNYQGLSQLLEICKQEKLHCFNGIEAIKNEAINSHSTEGLWTPSKYMAARGHKVMAKAVGEYLHQVKD